MLGFHVSSSYVKAVNKWTTAKYFQILTNIFLLQQERLRRKASRCQSQTRRTRSSIPRAGSCVVQSPPNHCVTVQLPSCTCDEIPEIISALFFFFFAKHPLRLQDCQTAVRVMCSEYQTLGMCSKRWHWKRLQSHCEVTTSK